MKKLDLRKKEDDNKSRILNRETISEFRKESKHNTLEIMKKDIRSAFTNPNTLSCIPLAFVAFTVPNLGL